MAQVESGVRRARAAVREVLAGLPAGSLVLVACSGGADSLALAAALAHEAPRVGRSVRVRAHGVRAGAVVVDHGLQVGSDDVAARAAEQCRGLGLDPVVVRGTTPGRALRSPGPEAAAREARYAVLEKVAAETGADLVLLGHTLDDQAEQVLLGLARGAGARSLAGMPAARDKYRRPFLELRRAETEAVCAASGLDYWVDPTNLAVDDDAPLRSRVRGAALPVLEDVLGPGIPEALARSARQLRDDADALDALAADLLVRARRTEPPRTPAGAGPEPEAAAAEAGADADGEPGADADAEPATGADAAAKGPGAAKGPDADPDGRDGVVLDVTVLESAPAAVRRRTLRLAAHEVTAAPTTARHLEALDALVVAWRGQGPAHLPGGARVERSCGRLFLRRERA